jgi:ABC-type transporter Mla maintaining outer membrane lipid asymmetry ATPase subunit MlaF
MDRADQNPEPAPPIEMHDVSASSLRDQNIIVVEGVQWTVQKGDYWLVAGLQGAGKSDFLMMTAGLVPPAAGSYRFFGEPMPIFDEHRLKKRLALGLVFETGQLFNHLTVLENIALPFSYHEKMTNAQAQKAVAPLIEELELGPWTDSTPGAIGRNWQKRVGLARALALKPKILLVDNPLSGVDPRHASRWLGFLDRLSKGHSWLNGEPVTLVVTAADLRPWKGRARQYAVLREKRFTVMGDWSQIGAASDELTHELLES